MKTTVKPLPFLLIFLMAWPLGGCGNDPVSSDANAPGDAAASGDATAGETAVKDGAGPADSDAATDGATADATAADTARATDGAGPSDADVGVDVTDGAVEVEADIAAADDAAPDAVPTPDVADAKDLTDAGDGATLPGDATVALLGEPVGWKFTEVALAAGIPWKHNRIEIGGASTLYEHGSGMAAGDFNGDGHADMLLLNQCGPTGYYLGKANGTFSDQSKLLQQLDDGVRVQVAHGDYDNDGDTDFFVTFVRRPCALLRQNADGSFTDVAAAAGVAAVGHYGGTTFVDFDRDGWLDLLVAGNIKYTDEKLIPASATCSAYYAASPATMMDLTKKPPVDPSLMYRNLGPGKGFAFTNVAKTHGMPGANDLAPVRGFTDVTMSDFDRDGDPDLTLTDAFGVSAVLVNDGTGHFKDEIATLIPQFSYGATNAVWADYDNDGFADLFLADMHSDMWHNPKLPYEQIGPGLRYKGYLGPMAGVGDNPTGPLYGNSLWLHEAVGKYKEVAMTWKAETHQPWGVQPADFDNDGDVDLFVATGMGNPYLYVANRLLVNLGDHFVDRQAQVGLDPPADGALDPAQIVGAEAYIASARTSVALDYDSDGDLDLAVMTYHHRMHLYRNDLPVGRHWLEVHLAGKAPRDPFGAWVEVQAGGHTYWRALDGARGYLSQAGRSVHFGLGAATQIAYVSVYWPDGTQTKVSQPAIDKPLTIQQK
ncbi:MAG: CRTAC1 family protein [Myxococcales bacterium]|nr:CRTAC1 family protein [Myxococcales bacterium]